jgi:hypothetical protein
VATGIEVVPPPQVTSETDETETTDGDETNSDPEIDETVDPETVTLGDDQAGAGA